MVKITMGGGTVCYKGVTWQAFRSAVNAANARGASCALAYTDQALTLPIQIVLGNVDFFEAMDATNPMVEVSSAPNPYVDPAPPV